ncbi:MAG TPA: pyroglutamyl-peptidase I [Roseiflexaceae bacterium]|jgi:pyroglutamyl-peptidase|nr:pyroglutamyl-peptidase I [Roseiflexaceae bacterium]
MPTLLLTAFEPFGDDRLNASAEVLHLLAPDLSSAIETHTSILPVDSVRAPERIRSLLYSLRPDWCVMLGQANGRAALSVERVAVNLLDFRIPDNGGHQPIDQPVVMDGPAAYFSTLPVKQLVAAAREVGTPAEQSLTAGAFLCNQASYVVLHTCAVEGLPTRCGFVHVPVLPEQVTEGRMTPSMELETMRRGLRAMLAALVAEANVADEAEALLIS